MPAECSASQFDFGVVEGRRVVAAFDGGMVTSDAGALLLGATDKAIGLVERFAGCFQDGRAQEQIEHAVATMVGQRVFGIALGYEDVLDFHGAPDGRVALKMKLVANHPVDIRILHPGHYPL